MGFVSTLEPLLKRYGFDHYGFARLERPLSMEVYREWLDRGQNADMHWLAENVDMKENPQRLAPRARSAVVIAKPYFPHPYGGESPVPGARVALYAQGGDYHVHFLRELNQMASALRMDFPSEEFLCFTDAAPILERDLAYRAGLGWVGKNSCLIHPKKGSLFFIGQIFTSLELESTQDAVADFCGSCDRCLRACPTGALEAPRWLNASKCIAYLTIEAREPAQGAIRSQIGDWFFGCDICQTVCPWNEKAHGREIMQALTAPPEANRDQLVQDLHWILNSSHREIERRLKNSPLPRARPMGLRRNAIVVIGNRRLHELRADVESSRATPALKEVADWALAQLT